MADWKFDLWATDAAIEKYKQLAAIAEGAVSSYLRPLPVNSDPKVRARLAAINHYERTRKILKSIVNPHDVELDRGLLGIYWHVRYRTELGTCVYYSRYNDPPVVLVYEFSESPLDYDALRKLIASGDAHILARLQIPLPQAGAAPPMIH